MYSQRSPRADWTMAQIEASSQCRALATAGLTLAMLTAGFVVLLCIVARTLLQEAAAIEHMGEVAVWLGGGAILLYFAAFFGSILCAMGKDVVQRLRIQRRLSRPPAKAAALRRGANSGTRRPRARPETATNPVRR